MSEQEPKSKIKSNRKLIVRLLSATVFLAAVIAFFSSGLHTRLSFDELAIRYHDLTSFVQQNALWAALSVITLYAVAVAAAFPAAWLLTVAIGLIFGWAQGAAMVVIGATIGASILYFVAQSLLADFYRDKAGAWLNDMAKGFRENAVGYMLFLRLAPVFPFLMVNVVPAILNVRFSTFVWTTAVGIIPGTIAYSYAGEGLRSIISERAEACAAGVPPCGDAISPGDLITPQMLIAFTLLGLVSLIPAILKRFRAARQNNS